jgi:alanine racemase
LGFREEELQEIIPLLEKNKRLVQIEGIFTHFANIEDSTNHFFAMSQWGKFLYLTQKIENVLKIKPRKHYACSAASLLFGEAVEGMVRLGISLYGLWPSRETYLSYLLKYGERRMQDALRPVLTWKTQVLQVKNVQPGETVGYGLTYQVTRKGKIAILPVGYWDGYDRGLSNKAYVLLNGQRAPVRGRICMNLMMVDISDIPAVMSGDEVILLGASGTESISAEQLATWTGTINYEIVTRINPQIPRYLVD